MTKAPGVDTSRLRPEILYALFVADYVYCKYLERLNITSTFTGKHITGSLHFKNRAFDALLPRTRVNTIAEEIRDFLGPEYDVVVESDHIHFEWDPK